MRGSAGLHAQLRRANSARITSSTRQHLRRASSQRSRSSPKNVFEARQCWRRSPRAVQYERPALHLPLCAAQTRAFASVAAPETREHLGPLQEYDRRVSLGILRNDEHQRGEERSLASDSLPSALTCHQQASSRVYSTCTTTSDITTRRPSSARA
jgi:protein AFG1